MHKIKTIVALTVAMAIGGCAYQKMMAPQYAQGGLATTAATASGGDGFGPDHNLRIGDPLPGRYRTSQYVIEKWGQHGLQRPPSGYHWVQAGADYLLVSAQTGVIEDTVRGK